MLFNRTKNRQSEVRATTFTEIFLIFLVILFLFVVKGRIDLAKFDENEVRNLNDKIVQLETIISELKEENRELKIKNESLEDDVAWLTQYVGSIPVGGEPPNITYKELEELYKKLKIRNLELEDKVKELEAEIELMGGRNNVESDLRDEIKRLKDLNNSLNKQISILKDQIKDLLTGIPEIEELLSRIEELEKEKQDLSKVVSNLQGRGGMDHPRCTVPNTSFGGDRDEYLMHIEVFENYFFITKRWNDNEEQYMQTIPGIKELSEKLPRISNKEYLSIVKQILNWGNNRKEGTCRFYVTWNLSEGGMYISRERERSIILHGEKYISAYFYQYMQSYGSDND